jgi:hypothetical protein
MEMIHFLEGKFPQYPKCAYARTIEHYYYHVPGQPYPEVRIMMVFCDHAGSLHRLCTTNHQEQSCPLKKKVNL